MFILVGLKCVTLILVLSDWRLPDWWDTGLQRDKQTYGRNEAHTYTRILSQMPMGRLHWYIARAFDTFLSKLKRSMLLSLIWQPLFNRTAFICGCQASYEGAMWRLAACRLAWPWSVSQGLLAECKIMLPNTVLFTARPTSSPANTVNI